MEFKTSEYAGTLLVQVGCTRIDAACAIQFKDAVRDLADSEQDRIVLDLSMVDFLDSSGLGAVVAALKAIGPNKTLQLAGLTPTVKKVFHLTRMDSVFTIHATATDAIEGLANAS
ncbi:Putative anti-sigma factor antagonist [Aquimixticola soesokkakensis]|uniref:Anti-sigma factor antagonist n=1 Tax=Aquimixticola soesokkakensis TaxID=1519096 RepID=A0A1Y5TUE5_9RHOB|nr:STAS domain-containing protein [Aquimixticola soesokkakensis]SLN68445.1 Putative anti-sigma factor antagonist [Aquimixticola soesokkakensis]